MDFLLSDEQKALKTVCSQIAKEYKPFTDKANHENEILPAEIRKKAIERQKEAGLLGLTIPKAHGGQGRPFIDLILGMETFCMYAPRNYIATYLVDSSFLPSALIAFDREELKKKYLRPLIDVELICAEAISEPEGGSSVSDFKTTAVQEGDHFVVNGFKRWANNGGVADLYYCYVRFNDVPGSKGIGTILIEKDCEGLSIGRDWGFWGVNTGERHDIIIKDCRVPKENVITGEGEFRKLMSHFNTFRLQNAACCLGYAQGALNESIDYSQNRKQFGKPICDFQMIQNKLADMVIKVEAARWLIYRAAVNAEAGAAQPLETSIAKTFANTAAVEVCDTACSIHGAYGFTRDFPVEWMYRHARGMELAAGTIEMQKIRIVSEKLNRRFKQ
jgi:butyryl-CoA dehydrogenase